MWPWEVVRPIGMQPACEWDFCFCKTFPELSSPSAMRMYSEKSGRGWIPGLCWWPDLRLLVSRTSSVIHFSYL